MGIIEERVGQWVDGIVSGSMEDDAWLTGVPSRVDFGDMPALMGMFAEGGYGLAKDMLGYTASRGLMEAIGSREPMAPVMAGLEFLAGVPGPQEALMSKMGPLVMQGLQYGKVLPRELWELAGTYVGKGSKLWKSAPQVGELADKDYFILYHGTNDRTAKEILKKGMLPGQSGGGNDWLVGGGFDRNKPGVPVKDMEKIDSQISNIYGTNYLDAAKDYAEMSAQNRGRGAKPVILEIKIPKDEAMLWKKDIESGKGSFFFNGEIPPDRITMNYIRDYGPDLDPRILPGEYMARDSAARERLDLMDRLKTMPFSSEAEMTPERMIYRYGEGGGLSMSQAQGTSPPLVNALREAKDIPVSSSIPSSPIITRAGPMVMPVELEVRDMFGSDLSNESKKIIGYYGRRRGETAVMPNTKTGLSIDFTTNCPNRYNPAKGPCPYCYVEHGRLADQLFNMKGGAKALTPEGQVLQYDNDILGWNGDLIRELNKDGGLRMFSFGDYIQDQQFDHVGRVLHDASQKDLYIKAITKQKEFVDDWGNHPNLRINISTDNVPREISANAPSVDEAMDWKAGRSNINIRAVALNPAEAEMFARDPRVRPVTLYHGLTNFDNKGNRHNKLLRIVMEQNKSLADKVGMQALTDYLDTWVNMKPGKGIAEELRGRFPGKMCCGGGNCSRDATKCGFAPVGGLLLSGVFLPMNQDGEPLQDEDVR